MEILFSVMILGIGFIMVAAMFPAALRQTQGNVEDSEFNMACRYAAESIQTQGYTRDKDYLAKVQTTRPSVTSAPRLLDQLTSWVSNGSAPPVVQPQLLEYDVSVGGSQASVGRPVPYSFHDPRLSQIPVAFADGTVEYGPGSPNAVYLPDALWNLVRGNMIISDRQQDAWVGLWSRPVKMVTTPNGPVRTADSFVNLIIIPVRSRLKPQYNPTEPSTSSASCDIAYNPANLDASLITFNYYPPTQTAITAPTGVLLVTNVIEGSSAGTQTPVSSNPTLNPVTEGAYVVVSDSQQAATHAPVAPAQGSYPGMFNGMIFKIGREVADATGNTGTSNGQYWAVDQVLNIPSETPYGLTDPSQIAVNDFSQPNIYALVVGRQPNPADPVQQSSTTRLQQSSANWTSLKALNRAGSAQELGYFLWSVTLQQ